MAVTIAPARAAGAEKEKDPAIIRSLIFVRDRGIFVLWALLLIGFSIWASPYFASVDNALLIANAAALTAIFAAGVAVGIICGALDLSIPGTAALASCVCGWLITHGTPTWVSIVVALVLGALGAFAAAGRTAKCVTDFGGNDEVLENVKAGKIHASVALQFQADMTQSFDTLVTMQADPKANGQILIVPQKVITAKG